jgi:hypothetical protein
MLKYFFILYCIFNAIASYPMDQQAFDNYKTSLEEQNRRAEQQRRERITYERRSGGWIKFGLFLVCAGSTYGYYHFFAQPLITYFIQIPHKSEGMKMLVSDHLFENPILLPATLGALSSLSLMMKGINNIFYTSEHGTLIKNLKKNYFRCKK